MGGVHKPGQSSNCAPGDQDAGDPNARPDLVKDEVTGDFKEEVAPKENSRRESERWLVMASSRFIVSAANPRLILSMKATTKSANRNGSSLILSLRIVTVSIGFETILGALAIRTYLSSCSLTATADMTMVCA